MTSASFEMGKLYYEKCEEITKLKSEKDQAYSERNKVVAALAHLVNEIAIFAHTFNVGVARHQDKYWDEETVTVTSKKGTMTNFIVSKADLDLTYETLAVNEGYIRNCKDDEYLHRKVAKRIFKVIPNGYFVDHIDTNRLNNSRWNLRLANQRGQVLNRTKPAKGYEKHGAIWRVYTKNNGKKIIGRYNTEAEAIKANKIFRESLKEISDKDGTYIYPDYPWDTDWKNILVITIEGKQMTWHFHDSEKYLLEGLPAIDNYQWDGHTTEEKYERLFLTCGIKK